MCNINLVKGQLYVRKELHERYGGNPQSGISYSANYPYIFLFNGNGEKFGYRNGTRRDEGMYHYTGEGQTGEQVFEDGNERLRTHIECGVRVFLFDGHTKGYCQYKGEYEYVDYMSETIPDKQGNMRRGIIFKLKELV